MTQRTIILRLVSIIIGTHISRSCALGNHHSSWHYTIRLNCTWKPLKNSNINLHLNHSRLSLANKIHPINHDLLN
ncbi:hypothetical protein V6Z12_A05G248100 [Gossypium hirsutum]